MSTRKYYLRRYIYSNVDPIKDKDNEIEGIRKVEPILYMSYKSTKDSSEITIQEPLNIILGKTVIRYLYTQNIITEQEGDSLLKYIVNEKTEFIATEIIKSKLSQNDIKVHKLVNNFFETLPQQIYIHETFNLGRHDIDAKLYIMYYHNESNPTRNSWISLDNKIIRG